jgi:hypothetical protein
VQGERIAHEDYLKMGLHTHPVMPAKAGIQKNSTILDSRLRGNDGNRPGYQKMGF